MKKHWTEMSFEERQTYTRGVIDAARREIESWKAESESKMKEFAPRMFPKDPTFKIRWQDTKSSGFTPSPGPVPEWKTVTEKPGHKNGKPHYDKMSSGPLPESGRKNDKKEPLKDQARKGPEAKTKAEGKRFGLPRIRESKEQSKNKERINRERQMRFPL